MSVQCVAPSEPQNPPPQQGQEFNLILNGQHQHHRGEDGPLPGKHNYQEGQDQAHCGQLVYHQGQEDHFSGRLHHRQRQDQAHYGQCLLQQGHHHHLVSKSLFRQTQDPVDERRLHWVEGLVANSTKRKDNIQQQHHRGHKDITATSTQAKLTSKTLDYFALDHFTVLIKQDFIKETGSTCWHQQCSSSHGPRHESS